jgi:hypothetical protein
MLCEVAPYEKRVKISDTKLLSQMGQEDILGIATEVEENALEWVTEFMAKFPELMELINAM